MSISQLYPEEGPTLNLNFAGSRTLDPRITFSRSQTTSNGSTYMGRDGLIKYAGPDEPRFDHRYVNGEVESLGLLVEEQRINLVTYSNGLSTWDTIYSQTLTQDVVGPDGIVNSAWTFDDTYTGGDGAFREKYFSVTPSTNQYCFSIFAKRGTSIWFDMYAFFIGSSTRAVYLNYVWATNTLTVGSAENSPPVPTVYGRIEYPNGWYRFYFVFSDPTGLNSACLFRLYPSSRNAGYVGSTLFYGAQVEQGSFPTSYIPTEGSTKTRNPDNVSMTGTNFTDWYNQSEGTVYADTRMVGVQTGRYDRLWAITNSNLNLEGISIFVAGPAGFQGGYVSSVTITNSATEQVSGTLDVSAITTPKLKSAFAFKQNDCASGYNGNLKFVDNIVDLSSFTTPLDRLLIGQPQRFQGYSCMTVSQLTYYPTRLTNSQLQNLTK